MTLAKNLSQRRLGFRRTMLTADRVQKLTMLQQCSLKSE
jgi:hypothetical protein